MEDPFNAPVIPIHTLSLGPTRVPNLPPTTTSSNYRLAIVGDCPTQDDETYGSPFLSSSAGGRLLDALLGAAGIARSDCFVGNLCKYRPPTIFGKTDRLLGFGYAHEHVLQGWVELQQELDEFKPNCILALGEGPLRFFTGRESIGEYRGSILTCEGGAYLNDCARKVVPSYTPAQILGDYKSWVLLKFDIMRARQEASVSTLRLPSHDFELDLSSDEICRRLDAWPSGLPASIDIEGGLNGWICLSVVARPNTGFIVAFGGETEIRQGDLYRSISAFLYRSDIPKILQNALYEGFVLGYGFNMVIRNVAEDTMLKQWEVYPELPKGLDTIASIWTRQPQWKFLIAYSKKEQLRRAKAGVDPNTEIRNKHYACCIDSSVTLEACHAMDSALTPAAMRHYRFNMGLLSPLLFMELRGINYDRSLASTELLQCNAALRETSSRLELRAGYSLNGAKGSISSTKLARCLYHEKGYPEQKKGRGPTAKVSTDVECLLKLTKKFKDDPFLADILLHRKLESIKETLEITTDPDGRIRCGYNAVGTDTGRLTCYTSPTGSGANLTTITKKLRKLYCADPDMWLAQMDLAGADGWTVAAHCLRHGDPTMWDDYIFGLKPAKILALMIKYGAVINTWSREEIKLHSKEIHGDSSDYFVCKVVQHGTNYGMKESMMQSNVMTKSYKMTGRPMYVEQSFCSTIQRYYFVRYPGLYSWHTWAKSEVFNGKNLVCGESGHTRTFFGRRKSWDAKSRSVQADHETWKEFLASEPQFNTTYSTNLALTKLWNDPLNRRGSLVLVEAGDTIRATRNKTAGGLIIQPLHQVHDALLVQFPKSATDFAKVAIPSYFANELVIAGTKVTIPFEGAYGPSWGEQGEQYGGGEI